ncbi:MAG: non-homologous end-joining DNA ligase [Bacillota bacterium]
MISNIRLNNHTVPVKNLAKVYWPDEGITKGDLMKYYSEVWPYLNPHLRNRPVSLVRYPDGIEGNFFYQKDVPDAPEWVETVSIPSDERVITYAMINNLETLIWSVNLGCIEVHPWLSTKTALDLPTYIIFDLDPMEPAVFSDAVKIALFVNTILKELALKSFPKISGATGIHIYLPVKRDYTFQQTSDFVKKTGAVIIKAFPNLATNERKVASRAGKVYIDHLQNLKGKTIASVYSIRPFPGAPASLPVTWEELPDTHPAMFTLKTAIPRLQKTGDLFEPLLTLKQTLPEI